MFIKKWWLEHEFLVKGQRVKFCGWINTTAERKEDFPDMLYGTFWASKNPETDGVGMRGRFHLDGDESDNDGYVYGSVYPVSLLDGLSSLEMLDRETAARLLLATSPMEAFPRFEARIEDCVDEDSTYITMF